MPLPCSILLFLGHVQVYDAGVDFLMNTAICRKVKPEHCHTTPHTHITHTLMPKRGRGLAWHF